MYLRHHRDIVSTQSLFHALQLHDAAANEESAALAAEFFTLVKEVQAVLHSRVQYITEASAPQSNTTKHMSQHRCLFSAVAAASEISVWGPKRFRNHIRQGMSTARSTTVFDTNSVTRFTGGGRPITAQGSERDPQSTDAWSGDMMRAFARSLLGARLPGCSSETISFGI